jgi:hypothetical protein
MTAASLESTGSALIERRYKPLTRFFHTFTEEGALGRVQFSV